MSKNVYINKVDDIVGECNTYYRTNQMKPVGVKDNTYFDFKEEGNDKDPKFKALDHVAICKYKIFVLKDTHQTGLKNFLFLVKLKTQFYEHMLLMISMVKKLLEHSLIKNYKGLIKKNLG